MKQKKDFALLKSRLTGELVSLTSRQSALIDGMTDTRIELRRLGEKKGNPELQKDYEADYAKMNKELREVEFLIEECKTKTKENFRLLDQGEFLELMKNLPSFIRNNKDMKKLDEIIRKIFLNFTVNQKGVIKSTLNYPFDMILKIGSNLVQ